MAVAAPLAGDLIDRHGPRRLLATGLGLVALGMGLTSIAHEPWHFLVAFGSIAGLGFGMVGANALFAAVGFTSMGVIETHFLPCATFCGFTTITTASAFGFLSGINLVGILVAGWRSDRMHRPTLPAVIYGLRGSLSSRSCSWLATCGCSISLPDCSVFSITLRGRWFLDGVELSAVMGSVAVFRRAVAG